MGDLWADAPYYVVYGSNKDNGCVPIILGAVKSSILNKEVTSMRKTEPRRKVEKRSQPTKRHLAVRTSVVAGVDISAEDLQRLYEAGKLGADIIKKSGR